MTDDRHDGRKDRPQDDDEPLSLNELAAFLVSDRTADDCMQLSDMDGFITAIAIGPQKVKPAQWLADLFGSEQPVFRDSDEARRVLGAIMHRFTEIQAVVRDDPESYEPIFWMREDGGVIAEDWAQGFMAGMGLTIEAWETMVQNEEGAMLLSPILAFASDDDEDEEDAPCPSAAAVAPMSTPLRPAANQDLACARRDKAGALAEEDDEEALALAEAAELIPSAVIAIDRYWRRFRIAGDEDDLIRSHGHAAEPNEPCPCGSGRQYRRCCGAH